MSGCSGIVVFLYMAGLFVVCAVIFFILLGIENTVRENKGFDRVNHGSSPIAVIGAIAGFIFVTTFSGGVGGLGCYQPEESWGFAAGLVFWVVAWLYLAFHKRQ